jgi:ParD-like antitoxin of type II bacterial toxin-antitoxin system
MSQPVKLSDALVLDARLAGEAMERSIARRVGFWARLGRAVEPSSSPWQANCADKSTFYYAHLECRPALRQFRHLGRELNLEAYPTARVADAVRRELVNQRESFVFEPVFFLIRLGDKLAS